MFRADSIRAALTAANPLPVHCALCRTVGERLCEPCAALLVEAPPPEPDDVAHLDRVVALFAYVGAGKNAIARLKYDNHRDALPAFAHLLAGAIDQHVDLVTWVPTSAKHRRERGYDQAELLARAVAKELGVRAVATLARTSTVAQRGQTRVQRRATTFRVRSTAAQRRLRNARVALVDDVRTTGASLDSGAVTLRWAGARSVLGATIAATP